jgi:hypothetical protein
MRAADRDHQHTPLPQCPEYSSATTALSACYLLQADPCAQMPPDSLVAPALVSPSSCSWTLLTNSCPDLSLLVRNSLLRLLPRSCTVTVGCSRTCSTQPGRCSCSLLIIWLCTADITCKSDGNPAGCVGVCVVEPDASCMLTAGHLTYMTLTRYSRHHKALRVCWNIQHYSRACCVCSAAPWRLAVAFC